MASRLKKRPRARTWKLATPKGCEDRPRKKLKLNCSPILKGRPGGVLSPAGSGVGVGVGVGKRVGGGVGTATMAAGGERRSKVAGALSSVVVPALMISASVASEPLVMGAGASGACLTSRVWKGRPVRGSTYAM